MFSRLDFYLQIIRQQQQMSDKFEKMENKMDEMKKDLYEMKVKK
jgi:hypothetical protein